MKLAPCVVRPGGVTSSFSGPLLLSALGLSGNTVGENVAQGTFIGSLSNLTPGSTLSLVDNSLSRVALSGTNLVTGTAPIDYEATTFLSVTVRETMAGWANSPRDTVLIINVNNEVAATLNALSLSSSSVTENTGAGVTVGTLGNRTPGSTLSMTNTAGNRFALSGTTVVTGSTSTDFETATSHSITVRETLGESPNSPRDTTFTITVGDVVEADFSVNTQAYSPMNFNQPSPSTYGGAQSGVYTLTGANQPVSLRFTLSNVIETAGSGGFYVQENPGNVNRLTIPYADTGARSGAASFNPNAQYFFYWDIATAGVGTQSAAFTVTVTNENDGNAVVGTFTCSGVVNI